MKGLFSIAAAACMLMLTACSVTEPEERVYALGMLIGTDGRLAIGTAKLDGESEGRPDCIFIDGRGDTISEAIADISSETGGRMYMGQLMLCAVEKDALDKKTLSELIALFGANDELSRGAAVIVTDSIDALKKGRADGKDIISFMREYYKSSLATGEGTVSDTDGLMYSLIAADGDALLPFAECRDGKIRINGGVAVNGFEPAKMLDAETYKAAAWLLHGKKGALTLDMDGTAVHFDKISVSKNFYGGVEYKIKARAKLFTGGGELDVTQAEKLLADRIAQAVSVFKRADCDYAAEEEFCRKKTGRRTPYRDIRTNIRANIERKGT